MSQLKRLERLVKSLVPRFPRDPKRQYTLDDARMMINEMGMDLQPQTLAYLVDNEEFLDEFINSVYHVENKLGKGIITESATIDPIYEPQAYEEDGNVGFTVKLRRKEVVFAEYEIPPSLG